MIKSVHNILRVSVFYLKGLRKSHRISRLLQIVIAIALFIGLDQLWETSLLQGQQLLKSQTEKMARLLVQQTAYGAAPALQLENDEQLQWLAQALVLDPKVMSASIFSEDGIRLSFAQSVVEDDLDAESPELSAILEQYPPYVEAVSQDGKNLGYVEVRLEPKYFFNEIKEAHQINMEQQQMMLLIAGLIGMLLSRALSFKRADFDRRKARVKLRRLLAKKKAKAETKAAKKQAAESQKQAKSSDSMTMQAQSTASTLKPEAIAETSSVIKSDHLDANLDDSLDSDNTVSDNTKSKVTTETANNEQDIVAAKLSPVPVQAEAVKSNPKTAEVRGNTAKESTSDAGETATNETLQADVTLGEKTTTAAAKPKAKPKAKPRAKLVSTKAKTVNKATTESAEITASDEIQADSSLKTKATSAGAKPKAKPKAKPRAKPATAKATSVRSKPAASKG
ncbi:YtjB family periplasmic protein [Shewanella sairae]|uniref:YtjB family periplasmic protein n=1 Tax=Shewanella sairae TaxID=190310 RepID=UPI001FEBEAEC|nr:AhpA/YtjB family protein [Shewanella sairae]MCL1130428.1 hypothetical protein [Shewanella sairae]